MEIQIKKTTTETINVELPLYLTTTVGCTKVISKTNAIAVDVGVNSFGVFYYSTPDAISELIEKCAQGTEQDWREAIKKLHELEGEFYKQNSN